MRLLIIIPCAKEKIWRREPKHREAAARDAYTSYAFRVNKAFAEIFAGAPPDKWMILSANYGLIDPDFPIPRNYDVSFSKPLPKPISIERLKVQVTDKNLRQFDLVIALGGKNYRDRIQKAFADGPKVIFVAKDESRSEKPKCVKLLTELDREEMLRRIDSDEDTRGALH